MMNQAHNTSNKSANNDIEKSDQVILLHGIFRSSRHMRKLATYLRQEGFKVFNMDYPSTKYNMAELVEIILNQINDVVDTEKTAHFVGYSMGGLLTRAVLSRYRPPHMGRVVLLAAPNKGSEVADWLKNFYPYKALYGKAGQQLTTNQDGIAHLFGEIDYELGIIAGDRSIDPICSQVINGANDGKVSIESTKLEGMKEHITVHATHTFFPHNKQVHRHTASFLKNGTFEY